MDTVKVKMTKGQRTRILRSALYHAERAKRFIMDKDTTVCRDYGRGPQPITKDIGSDLVGIDFAIDDLRRILTAETGQMFEK